MRNRTVGTAIGAVCLAVVATGCSSGSASKSADAAKDASPSAAPSASGDAKADGTGRGPAAKALSGVLGESRTKLSASNSFQTTMTTKIDGQAMMTVTSQMQYKPELAIRMTMKFEPSFIEQSGGDPSDMPSMQYLMTPDVMYMNMGPKMAAENGGKPWAKIDIAALAKADKSGQGAKLQKMFDQAQDNQSDPASQLALLQQSGDIREVGKETVGGVQTTHYSGTVNLATLQKNSADSMGLSPKEYDKLVKQYDKLGMGDMNMDMWIGADNLPVKQKIVMHVEADGEKADMEMTSTFSKWGTKVDTTPPPASQTRDVTADMAAGKF
ncbi:hypothetical protein ACPA54_08020 [Uniformispora flossi]|uniref:hypothetical protein n=1 Tax=Uniformispora flossi TaxID=3390723 RepID=UPI003C2D9D7B